MQTSENHGRKNTGMTKGRRRHDWDDIPNIYIIYIYQKIGFFWEHITYQIHLHSTTFSLSIVKVLKWLLIGFVYTRLRYYHYPVKSSPPPKKNKKDTLLPIFINSASGGQRRPRLGPWVAVFYGRIWANIVRNIMYFIMSRLAACMVLFATVQHWGPHGILNDLIDLMSLKRRGVSEKFCRIHSLLGQSILARKCVLQPIHCRPATG